MVDNELSCDENTPKLGTTTGIHNGENDVFNSRFLSPSISLYQYVKIEFQCWKISIGSCKAGVRKA